MKKKFSLKLNKSLIFLLGLLFTITAPAYDESDLFEGLNHYQQLEPGKPANFYAIGLYQGYIWGIHGAVAAHLCVPEDVTQGEILEISH